MAIRFSVCGIGVRIAATMLLMVSSAACSILRAEDKPEWPNRDFVNGVMEFSVYTLAYSVQRPRGHFDKPEGMNEYIIRINGIPVLIHRGFAGGELGSEPWIGKGKNEIQLDGTHDDVIRVNIGGYEGHLERDGRKVVVAEGGGRSFEVANLVLNPEETSKRIEFEANVAWPLPEADDLDTSDAGKARDVHDITAYLEEIQRAARTKDNRALQGFGQELFSSGAIRHLKVDYFDVLHGQRLFEKSVKNAGDLRSGMRLPTSVDKLTFIHGRRGILVYSQFDAPPIPTARLFFIKEGKYDIGLRPFVFLRVRGKWQAWLAES